MGGLAEQWAGWEVQILLLSSLLLQVLLLVFSEWRRRVSGWALLSAALNGIVWLLYQLADSVAIYVLGHMSLSSKPHEQQQLTAFWASLLLVHLGGQDIITAYAMEDNDLWLRHLLTLVVQAAGAAYVLYRYIAGEPLLAASVLMFVVGVIKYGERIYALKSSGLDSIRKFLDGFEVPKPDERYPVTACSDDPEEVLQGAHDLLHVCMGQFVDYKVWPSRFQTEAILVYHDRTNLTAGRSMLTQLVGMQLSLMRDTLYTKAMVLGAWYGCLSRVVFIVAMIVAFYLFQAFTMGAGSGYSRRDMVVTYILLSGAFLLEGVSLLRTGLSTWTCAWLRASGWNRLHAAVACLRRGVKAAQRCRKWSGFIGQHDIFQLHEYGEQSGCYFLMSWFGLEQWWSRLHFLDSAVIVISHDVEDLVVREIQRMVEAYGQNDHTLRGHGQLALGAWGNAGAGAGLYDGVVGVEEAGFDGNILAWYFATDTFLRTYNLCGGGGTSPIIVTEGEDMDGLVAPRCEEMRRQEGLAKAIRTLSRYMVFLLVERPHLLPSPVRRSQYDNFCAKLKLEDFRAGLQSSDNIHLELRLANNTLKMCANEGVEEVLQVMSRVWVEMLCYAASHCSNDSHGRQLSSSTEFITLTWILTTALYNRFQHDDPQFIMIAGLFLQRHERRRERNKRKKRLLSAASSAIWALVSGNGKLISGVLKLSEVKNSLDNLPA